jgi:hypothetical protein
MVTAPELLRWFSMITPASWLIRLLNQTDRTPYLSIEAYYLYYHAIVATDDGGLFSL